jgi:homoserine kinase type II
MLANGAAIPAWHARWVSVTRADAPSLAAWGLSNPSISVLGGGMNSRTWLVETADARFVAKAVPRDRRSSYEAGLLTATWAESSGVPCGAPVPTLAGDLVVDAGGSALALLRFVDGVELTGASIEDLNVIGTTLGRLHRALLGRDLPNATPFPWLDPAAGHLSTRPWIRPAIVDALTAWRSIPPESLAWAPLHTDPAPEAFRLDAATGVCGLIDWDMGVVGPLLYDLASAQMYVGGPARSGPLIAAYAETGALALEEIERALPVLARVRWAVQADYFAKRIAADDLTGIDDRSGNEKGLEDARRGLLG